MAVAIGVMRERVSVVRESRVQRSDGGWDVTTSTIATHWARVHPVMARESEQSGRLAGRTTYLITLYRSEDIYTSDTLVWATNGDIQLNIREVRLPGDRPLLMDIVAESGVVT